MSVVVLLTIPLLLMILIADIVTPSIAFFTVACLFNLLGIIDTATLLRSFANPTLMTLIVLLLVSVAIERTTLIRQAAKKLITRQENTSLLRLVSLSAVLSAFINNTAVVSAFLSAVARQKRINPSRLLIPLSYASMLGGVVTLIGTSTNLIVNSFVVAAGHEPIHMFSFAYIGIPIALLCLPLLIFLGKRLPERAVSKIGVDKTYFLSALVKPGCELIGKTVRENGLLELNALSLLEIEREGRLISSVGSGEIIEEGDLLVFTGSVDQVSTLNQFTNLDIHGEKIDDLLSSNLIEVVIAKEADIVNRSIRRIDFRSMFDAGVVGIRRHGKRLRGQLDAIRLKIGDNLILAAGADFHQHILVDKNFHLLDQRDRAPGLNRRKSLFVISGFITAILAATFGVISLFNALILLLGALLVTRCLTTEDLKNRFPFDLLIVIGSSLAISEAMMHSGAADIIGESMKSVFLQSGVYGAMIGVFLMTVLLTETVTNNAAAAIAVPIAISTAEAYHVDIMPFIMCVAYGASACFLMPFGYQTHLMVFSPGNYKVKDFVQTGAPITIIYCLLVVILVPMVFPFR